MLRSTEYVHAELRSELGMDQLTGHCDELTMPGFQLPTWFTSSDVASAHHGMPTKVERKEIMIGRQRERVAGYVE